MGNLFGGGQVQYKTLADGKRIVDVLGDGATQAQVDDYNKAFNNEKDRVDQYGKDYAKYIADAASNPGRTGTILTDNGIDFKDTLTKGSVL